MLQRLESTSEIGQARAVSDLIFEPVKNSHLAVPALMRNFEKTADENLKVDCLTALGKIGSNEALQLVQARGTSRTLYAQRQGIPL